MSGQNGHEYIVGMSWSQTWHCFEMGEIDIGVNIGGAPGSSGTSCGESSSVGSAELGLGSGSLVSKCGLSTINFAISGVIVTRDLIMLKISSIGVTVGGVSVRRALIGGEISCCLGGLQPPDNLSMTLIVAQSVIPSCVSVRESSSASRPRRVPDEVSRW